MATDASDPLNNDQGHVLAGDDPVLPCRGPVNLLSPDVLPAADYLHGQEDEQRKQHQHQQDREETHGYLPSGTAAPEPGAYTVTPCGSALMMSICAHAGQAL